METLEGSDWDVLIAGTGLQQSLLALALSRSDKKVLHVDQNDFYGGSEAAFSLEEAEDWAARHESGSSLSTCFECAKVARPRDEESGDGASKLGFSRAYSLSLSPQVIYTLSTLLPVLVSSKVYRQLDFLAIGSWWVYTPPTPSSDSSTSTTDAASAKLRKIPSGREDVFADHTLDLKSKRALMKFLRFVVDFDDKTDVWESHSSAPFLGFLTEQFGIPANLHNPILALTLSPSPPQETTTAFALPRIARHLRSIGIFGPGFGSVLPKWGGLAEICQVGCRAGAVGGAVYVLGKGVDKVDGKAALEADEASSEPGPRLSARLKDGEQINARWIVGCHDDLPQDCVANSIATPPAQATPEAASKSITIVSSPLQSLFPMVAEGSPPPAGAVVVFPTGSLSTTKRENDLPPVYVFVHNSDTGQCPAGQSILYASTSLTGAEGVELLTHSVEMLVSSVDEDPSPQVLWSLRYEQKSALAEPLQSSGDAPSQPAQTSGGVLKFPSLSMDLAFDDSILTRVREAWLKIMELDADGFMDFEDREGVADDYDDD